MNQYLTILPAERDNYGQYAIAAGQTTIFPFAIPMFGSLQLTIAHLLPSSQDFSIDIWISDAPLDGLLLRDGFGHIKANRRAEHYTIYDAFLKRGDDDDRLFLPSGKSYYLNVKNLQNRHNTFQLDFQIPE
jgi:hypothetical protein